MPMSSKEWRAREDAHTLAEAEQIKRNPKKLNDAKEQVKNIGLRDQESVRRVIQLRTKKGGRVGAMQKMQKRGNLFNVFKKI